MSRGKVIVTGGAGFIGSHTVVELEAAGYEPVIVDDFSNSDRRVLAGLKRICDREVVCHEVDCAEPDAFRGVFEREGAIRGAIHFAASKAVGESVQVPLMYYKNNLGSLITLLELMKEFEVSDLVFSSSCTVYGQPDVLPVTEETPMRAAESPYGYTKQVCESIIRDVVRAKDPLRAVVLRYFNPIGAHPSAAIGELPLGSPENLVPFITQSAAGLRGPLTVFGNDYPTPDGSCIRDYIHVVDLAKAHVKSLDWLGDREIAPHEETFNVGTGRGASVLEAIAAFESAAGRKLDYSIGARRDGDIVQIFADVDKAERGLGWKADLSMEDAMRDAWRWQLALQD